MTAKLPDTSPDTSGMPNVIFALLIACGSVALMWALAAAMVATIVILKGCVS